MQTTLSGFYADYRCYTTYLPCDVADYLLISIFNKLFERAQKSLKKYQLRRDCSQLTASIPSTYNLYYNFAPPTQEVIFTTVGSCEFTSLSLLFQTGGATALEGHLDPCSKELPPPRSQAPPIWSRPRSPLRYQHVQARGGAGSEFGSSQVRVPTEPICRVASAACRAIHPGLWHCQQREEKGDVPRSS